MPEVKLRVKQVRKIIQNLQTNKASGLDEVPVIVLKNYVPALAHVVTRLDQASYDSGIFPDDCKYLKKVQDFFLQMTVPFQFCLFLVRLWRK